MINFNKSEDKDHSLSPTNIRKTIVNSYTSDPLNMSKNLISKFNKNDSKNRNIQSNQSESKDNTTTYNDQTSNIQNNSKNLDNPINEIEIMISQHEKNSSDALENYDMNEFYDEFQFTIEKDNFVNINSSSIASTS